MYTPSVVKSSECFGTPRVPVDGTCGVPKHVGDLTNYREYIKCI